MKESYFKQILDLAPKVTAADARRQHEESEAARLAATEQADIDAQEARIEAEALLLGEQINLLLNTNPNIPPAMPRFESTQVGLGQPRDHTDPATGAVSQVRDPIYKYQPVGYLRPLFTYGKRNQQLSIGDDNRLYPGVGQSPDKPVAEGAYDMQALPGRDALELMQRKSSKEALARLLMQTDNFSDQISDKRADELRYEQQRRDRADSERAAIQAEKDKKKQQIIDRQAELAVQTSLIDQMVDDLDLETAIDDAIAAASDEGRHTTVIELAGIHTTKPAIRNCNNTCPEDQAVQTELNRLANDYPGWALQLQAPVGGSADRKVLIVRQN